MIADQIRDGRIVMVASTLGLMGLIGYAQYSPTKFAIRGLAECLRQEFLPYGIGVSVYFVSTIHSPGYEAENKTKPKITRMIEDGEASDASPKARAAQLMKGTNGPGMRMR
jgi:3-dehydrosphinganine reductase